VILAASFRCGQSTPEKVKAAMSEFATLRQSTQPAGATLGSIFKNPPGDYAGRLIEAAGLKGSLCGEAEISAKHANFFINHGQATASDFRNLIELAQQTVRDKFDVSLELEIDLVGEWQQENIK